MRSPLRLLLLMVSSKVVYCHLFDIYINDLSLTLSKRNKGCRLGGRVINHIAHADDLCILSMSTSGIP